jgi:hypothetical protein
MVEEKNVAKLAAALSSCSMGRWSSSVATQFKTLNITTLTSPITAAPKVYHPQVFHLIWLLWNKWNKWWRNMKWSWYIGFILCKIMLILKTYRFYTCCTKWPYIGDIGS